MSWFQIQNCCIKYNNKHSLWMHVHILYIVCTLSVCLWLFIIVCICEAFLFKDEMLFLQRLVNQLG